MINLKLTAKIETSSYIDHKFIDYASGFLLEQIESLVYDNGYDIVSSSIHNDEYLIYIELKLNESDNTVDYIDKANLQHSLKSLEMQVDSDIVDDVYVCKVINVKGFTK